MTLFNEFHNKNLDFIYGYINQVNSGTSNPLTVDEFKKKLYTDKQQQTSAELIDCILNTSAASALNLFIVDEDGSLEPILYFEDPLPPLLSSAERAWLKYVLLDKKAALFMNPSTRKMILSHLADENSPLDSSYFDSRYITSSEEYSSEYIHVFKELVFSIKHTSYVEITFSGSTGGIDFLPYRIRYDNETDTFFVLGYDVLKKDILDIPVADIHTIAHSTLGQYSEDDNNGISYEDYFTSILDTHRVSEPVQVEVICTRTASDSSAKSTMANDRFSYLFADYNTVNYINESGNIISDIYYYDFQYDDLLKKLLSLGKYVIVKSPCEIREVIRNIIVEKASLYKD